ncbi:MAG: hypothetical protein LH473_09490 [Chitinophagales bacterium]|nr:hypothetical protein [Chitinophagales bacterium]
MKKYFLLTVLFSMQCFLFITNSIAQDARANNIADSVMIAMGGKQNWDNTHFIKWTFFGRRTLLWDKYTGNVRIEIPAKQLIILTNINTKQGKVFRNKIELTQADSNAYFMDRGYKIWANDSYWLLMPFKLKDQGVTISYEGTEKDSSNNSCYVLQLTFNKVGVTPDNKYHIFVDRKTYLVTQWAFFEKFSDAIPEFIDSWNNYERYGNILLSGDRGKYDGKLTDIAVMDAMSQELFEKP